MKTNVKKIIQKIWRYPLKKHFQKKLKNRNFVLISSNCIGGCLLHDIGERFDTPTINLVIPEFVSFCEKIEYYLKKAPVVDGEEKYPILKIEDITIHGIHYKNAQDFLMAWDRRVVRFFEKRENGAEIIIMAADTQLQELNAKERFLALPYKKVCFTSNKEWTDGNEFIYVPEFRGAPHVGDLTKYISISGLRIFEKDFDCISFLNNTERGADFK